jgi:hypothetical protein
MIARQEFWCTHICPIPFGAFNVIICLLCHHKRQRRGRKQSIFLGYLENWHFFQRNRRCQFILWWYWLLSPITMGFTAATSCLDRYLCIVTRSQEICVDLPRHGPSVAVGRPSFALNGLPPDPCYSSVPLSVKRKYNIYTQCVAFCQRTSDIWRSPWQSTGAGLKG